MLYTCASFHGMLGRNAGMQRMYRFYVKTVKTCGKNFKGVCPMGTIQRSQDDFHDCTKTMGEKMWC